MKSTNKLIKYAILFLFAFSLWGFLVTKTKFSSSMGPLVVVVCYICLFGAVFFKYAKGSVLRHKEISLWMPYLIYTCLGYALQGKIQFMVFWFVPIVVLLLSYNKTIINSIPRKLWIFSAIISAIGVFTQLFYPPLQLAVSSIYKTDEISKWIENNTGCAGFTYQLAQTAALIIMGMPCVLYWNFFKKRYKDLLLIFLLFVGLILSGKRSFTVLSVINPLLIYLFASNANTRFSFLLFSIVLMAIVPIISFDVESIMNIPGLKRFAEAFVNYQAAEDITTGRSEIWTYAFLLFEKHPIFGIGVGEFSTLYDEGTAAHNTYISVLCEQGIVGFVLFVLPLIVCLLSTISLVKQSTTDNMKWLKLSLYLQLFYIFYSFTGNTNYNQYGYQFYFVAISILVYIKYYSYENSNICSQLNRRGG